MKFGVASQLRRIEALRRLAGRDGEPFEVTVGGEVREPRDIERWRDAGVHRLVVSPWRRSREAVLGLRRYAETIFG